MNLIHHATAYLAATPAPTGPVVPGPTSINFDGIRDFALYGIVPIVLLAIGLVITMRARNGNMSQAVTTSGISIIGLVFIGAAGILGGVGVASTGILFK